MPNRRRGDRVALHPRDFHVLLVLAGQPLHGYAIVQEIQQQSEGRVRLDPANLYRTLGQLDEEGLIAEVEPEQRPDDARKRRYYALTEHGQDRLRTEVERMRALTALADARMDSTGRS